MMTASMLDDQAVLDQANAAQLQVGGVRAKPLTMLPWVRPARGVWCLCSTSSPLCYYHSSALLLRHPRQLHVAELVPLTPPSALRRSWTKVGGLGQHACGAGKAPSGAQFGRSRPFACPTQSLALTRRVSTLSATMPRSPTSTRLQQRLSPLRESVSHGVAKHFRRCWPSCSPPASRCSTACQRWGQGVGHRSWWCFKFPALHLKHQ